MKSLAITLNALSAILLCGAALLANAQDEPVGTGDAKPGVVAADEAAAGTADATDPPTAVDLLSEDFPKGWKHVCSKEGCVLEDIWHRTTSADNGATLICSGEPKGLIFTELQVENFELTLEWRYPTDEKGNSGILVYVQPSQHLWPDSMQVQLHQPEAGSVFPSGDAESANTSEARDHAKPVGEWNTCRIVSIDGTLTVEVNGKPAGKVSGCKPRSGAIGFQSEGSEIHFRKVLLTTHPPTGSQPNAPKGAAITKDGSGEPDANSGSKASGEPKAG